MSNNFPKLFFSNTRVDKNLKYLLGCNIEDDIAVLKQANRLSILASALEINRLKNESKADEVVAMESLKGDRKLRRSELVAAFIGHVTKKKTIIVHENFPFGLASNLQVLGFGIKVEHDTILAECLIKSAHELSCIKKVLAVVGGCFERVRETLRRSKIGENGILKFQGVELTSEFIRADIENFCYANGCLAENTILACGRQSASPHCQGWGPICANQFIVMDLFPFDRASGYYADITRTFLRGTPTDAQADMYEAVKVAQEAAHKQLKAGIHCEKLMGDTLKFFTSKNYGTDETAPVPYGMFHSLGHGFGLSVHEEPYISNCATTLRAGNVVTLEPGLYYPEIGGVRIEDDFAVTDRGSIKLSAPIPQDWVIN
ncbi:MAG: Xaa-Pro peptidase family protein [Puniceicoccales bacterium]|jgi:Xaa-Pro aminopeptidase|nr:Xaa-Pro peptidase family protein [Puniceicoccales bacterium]